MSLMSEQSRQALAEAFSRAARVGLVRAPEDAFEIEAVKTRTPTPPPGARMFLITTSSFAFRLLTMFRVVSIEEARAYYGGTSDANLDGAFAEIANLCCGALNRELAFHFPHLGMSIPYMLSDQCLSWLEQLKPDYVAHYSLTVGSTVRVDATLCMCCSAPVEVITRAHAATETTGELELF
jgi:hypothetical protein